VKCDPVIADRAPTKGHNGRGVRSHIEEKSPKPIAAVARVGGGCDRRSGYSEEDGESQRRGRAGVGDSCRRVRGCAVGERARACLCSERGLE
jgi:hypothetical protein